MQNRFIALIPSLFMVISMADVFADENHDATAKAIDYRESLMTIFKWNMGPLGAMASD